MWPIAYGARGYPDESLVRVLNGQNLSKRKRTTPRCTEH
jgi:hypothetical protein